MSKAKCKPTQQFPRLLDQQCWQRCARQKDAMTPNDVRTCSASWNGYVGRAVQTDPTLSSSWNKRNVGSCWLKV